MVQYLINQNYSMRHMRDSVSGTGSFAIRADQLIQYHYKGLTF